MVNIGSTLVFIYLLQPLFLQFSRGKVEKNTVKCSSNLKEILANLCCLSQIIQNILRGNVETKNIAQKK